jgi:hypothetical protein
VTDRVILDQVLRPTAPTLAPRVGAKVWLTRDGRSGRVVAHAQGGLLCRVRLEDGAAAGEIVQRPGCELLPLAGDAGSDPWAAGPREV